MIARFVALALKELRILSRDLHGLAVLFLMPTAFILIMSLALQDAYDRESGAPMQVITGNADTGALAAAVIDNLQASPGSALRFTDLREDELAAALRSGQADFAVYFPPDFSRRLFDPQPESAPLFTFMSTPEVMAPARNAFRAELIGAISRVQGAHLIARMEKSRGADLMHLRRVMNPEHWQIAERVAYAVDSARGSAPDAAPPLPTAVQQSVPAWLVFSMFFVVVPLSTVLIIEREQGSLLRLRALHVSAPLLLLARVPPYYLINMVQMGLMLAVGLWCVPLLGGDPLELGAHPAGLLLIGSAVSFAAIGLALLVAVLARTSVQAIALGGVVNLVFGALGGIMVPKLVMPPAMQAATVISPMSWGLEGFWDIILRGGDWLDALPEAAALAGFGLLTLAAAALIHSLQYR